MTMYSFTPNQQGQNMLQLQFSVRFPRRFQDMLPPRSRPSASDFRSPSADYIGAVGISLTRFSILSEGSPLRLPHTLSRTARSHLGTSVNVYETASRILC